MTLKHGHRGNVQIRENECSRHSVKIWWQIFTKYEQGKLKIYVTNLYNQRHLCGSIEIEIIFCSLLKKIDFLFPVKYKKFKNLC